MSSPIRYTSDPASPLMARNGKGKTARLQQTANLAQGPLGVDADTHEAVAALVTTNGVGDGEVPTLLDQVDDPIAQLSVDGAYDYCYGQPSLPMVSSAALRCAA